MLLPKVPGFALSLLAIFVSAPPVLAQTPTPIHGHYPPGQTGLRGAASPAPGWSFTDFNRLFSNLDIKDQAGNTAGHVGEARYANIAMIGWTSDYTILGMNYGAVVGVPFATGNLNPDSSSLGQGGFDLGDIIVTPVALYGSKGSFDFTAQLSVWTPSGRFKPGAADNRGSGFWSLIYSAGAIWYPHGNRAGWSISAIARIEQNFEQAFTGIRPGDNLDIDWGIGRLVRLGPLPLDIGVSGFGTWQINDQSGSQSVGRYRYYGIGPEVSMTFADRWTARVRAQWELAARNAVQGNNIWFIINHRL